MKALRYLGPNTLEVRQLPDPVPQSGEVLLRVRACGICGSDVHGYLGLTGRRIPPMTMGHEFAAEVVGAGHATAGFKPGDSVVVQPINFCGECVNCKRGLTNMCLNKKFFGVLTVDGALAEYVAVPEKLLYHLPAGCSYEMGALTEPYAVAYGSLVKSGSLKDQTVMIIGAGTIGLCILQLAKLHNPQTVVVCDLSEARLQAALDLGADAVINPGNEEYLEAVERLTGGRMLDVTIEAVGVEATANQSVKALKVGGVSVWVGMSQKEMTINMQDVVCSAREIRGSFNYTHKEFGEVVNLLGSGKIAAEKLISKIISLKEAPDTFAALHEHPDRYIKILVDPQKQEGA